MKTSLRTWAVVGALALAGCGSKGEGAYEGTWKMDFTELLAPQRAALEKAGSPPEAIRMLDAKLKEMKGELVIKSDHTFTMDMNTGEAHESSLGTWKLEGESISLTETTKDGKPAHGDDAKPVTLTLKDGKLQGKAPKGDMTVTFTR